MNHFIPITQETFLRLRRDRIFLPAACAGIVLILFSGLASYWGVEEFFKILYDLGTTAYHLTGATVAIFWGIKIINDSQQEGSLEVQLASPVGRVEWLISKFFGLAIALCFLGSIFLLGWQLIYFAYGMGFMGWDNFLIFAVLTLSWIVVAAVAILMATLTSYAIALFSTFWIFFFGLLTAPIMQSMSPETPKEIQKFVEVMAGFWNLHYFNLYEHGILRTHIDFATISSRLGYAIALIVVFLGIGSWFFKNKDLVA